MTDPYILLERALDAVVDEDVDEVQRLLGEPHGPTIVNMTGVHGHTLLSMAAFIGCLPMVDMLLRRGATHSIHEPTECSPIHLASESGHVSTIRLLLAHGSECNGRGYQNKTPLMHAAREAQCDALRELIAQGADVNAVDDHGRSALHHVVSRKNDTPARAECVLILCAAGATVDHERENGWTSLGLACFTPALEVVVALLRGGADPTQEVPMITPVGGVHPRDAAVVQLGSLDGVRAAHEEWIKSLPLESPAVQRWLHKQPGPPKGGLVPA